MSDAPPGRLARLKQWARAIRRDVVALWLAARDPRTLWTARAFCAAVAAYALSPIDLISDAVPLLGLLDEALLLPLAVVVAVRLIPPPLMAEFREEATRWREKPVSLWGAAVVLLWLGGAALLARALW